MIYVGVQHMKGTSKRTGEEYDFYAVQALAKNARTSGLACQTVNVSPKIWEQFPLEPGDQFRATTDGWIVPLDKSLSIDISILDQIL